MSEIARLAATIFKRAAGRSRFVIAIAGPPGAGKSTLAEELKALLPEGQAVVVPMDGFHFRRRRCSRAAACASARARPKPLTSPASSIC